MRPSLPKSLQSISTIVLLLVLGSAAAEDYVSPEAEADDYVSPEAIEGSTRIDAEALIELARDKDDLVIIDSRIRADRRQGFITGSISLSDIDTTCTSLFSVIETKSTPTVFYCNGPKCRRSDRAVMIAKGCGYTTIYWFRGGFEEWKSKNYLISK